MSVINPPPQQIPKPLTGDKEVEGFFRTLLNSVYQSWFSMGGQGRGLIPPTLTDTEAANGTLYYSSTAGKLVFKDSGGVVNNLY